jgi:hypothetical protein
MPAAEDAAGFPQVAAGAEGEQRDDHQQPDDPVAGAALAFVTAFGARLAELEPVDDLFGLLVGLVDERELRVGVASCRGASRCGAASGGTGCW